MQIIDPHVHIWDLSTGQYPGLEKPSTGFIGNNAPIARSYLLDELLAVDDSEIEILKIVNVEAFPVSPLAEARYLRDLFLKQGHPHGIVAACDLSGPDAAETLESLAQIPNVKGIRQVLNRHSDPLYTYVSRDFMHDDAWRKSFGLLERHGFSFDLQLYPHQMDDACALIAAHPGTLFLLNHTGMWADRTLTGWRIWREGLRRLAAFPNCRVKISGLGMFDHAWTLQSIRPLVYEAIDAFGTDRAMFASNFPVDSLFSGYAALWKAFSACIADFSKEDRHALFCTNAARAYRIEDTP